MILERLAQFLAYLFLTTLVPLCPPLLTPYNARRDHVHTGFALPPQMHNFLYQIGLAFLRLGGSSTALRYFDRAEEALLQYSRHDRTDDRETLERPFVTATIEEFRASLHYHRYLAKIRTLLVSDLIFGKHALSFNRKFAQSLGSKSDILFLGS